MNSAVFQTEEQALKAFSALFSQLEILQDKNLDFSNEKAGFLGVLWQRLLDFAFSIKEISLCEDLMFVVEKIFDVLITFQKRNQKDLVEKGVLQKIIPSEELFFLGKQVFLLNDSVLIVDFFQVLGLRHPPKLYLGQELEGEIEQISEFILKGANYGDPLIAAEALNTLFDVFQNEAYDHILRRRGVLELINVEQVRMCFMNGKNQKKFLKKTP